MGIIETKVGFSTKHPIVDVETSNDIPRTDGRPDYSKCEICVAGFFVGGKITQFMVTDKSELGTLREQISKFLSAINKKQPHAFNVRMEEGSFNNLLGKYQPFYEIQPFKGKGVNKDYCYNYLIKHRAIPYDSIGFEDPLKGDGGKCPKCWAAGKFEEVRLHNVWCLVKEARVLQHSDFLRKEFAHLLNGDGWLKDGASLPPLG